jgi:hypothetical protein
VKPGRTAGGEEGGMAEVALFDLDGTLVDSNYQHAFARRS